MKRNKNKSGFTLVEVIVVMTMMSILLGAILNLMKPVNEAFSNAKSVANTNQTGSGLNRYIEGQIRYSTNILVLKNYQGVPSVSATGVVGSTSSPVSYTDCLIIDNYNKRGTQDPSYDPTSTVSRRMGCTGTIIHVNKLKTEGLNLKNAKIAMGEDFYGNETYKFDPNLETDDKYVTFRLNSEGYQYNIKNGQYEFDENRRFVSKRAFDLININNDANDSFKAESCDSTKDADIYTKYPKATTVTGTASGLTALYTPSGSEAYTYVFYTKSSESVNCTLTFNKKVQPGDADIIETRTVVMGGQIPFSQVPTLPNKPHYGIPYYICTSGSLINKEFRNADDWNSITITENLSFQAVYNPDTTIVQYTAYFYNCDKTTLASNIPGGGTAPVNGYPYTNTIVWVPDDFVSGAPANTYNTNYTFKGWAAADGTPFEDYQITGDGAKFYPVLEAKPEVTFEVSGAVVPGLTFKTDKGLIDPTKIPSSSSITIPDSKIFKGWFEKNSGAPIESYNVDSDVTFVAKFSDPPSAGLSVISCVPTIDPSNHNHLSYKIVLHNENTTPVNNWTLVFNLPVNASNLCGSSGNFNMNSNHWQCSGDHISYNSTTREFTVKTNIDSPSNYVTIPAKGDFTLTYEFWAAGGDLPSDNSSDYEIPTGSFVLSSND